MSLKPAFQYYLMVNLLSSFKKQHFGKLIHLEKDNLISRKWAVRELIFHELSCSLPLQPTEEIWVYLKDSLDTVPLSFVSTLKISEKASDCLVWSTCHHCGQRWVSG